MTICSLTVHCPPSLLSSRMVFNASPFNYSKLLLREINDLHALDSRSFIEDCLFIIHETTYKPVQLVTIYLRHSDLKGEGHAGLCPTPSENRDKLCPLDVPRFV